MRRAFALLLALTLTVTASVLPAWAAEPEAPAADAALDTSGFDMEYYTRFQGQGMEVNVYNWGEYISDGSEGTLDVNAEFEKLTGIKVNYSNFETNEGLYAKLKGGASSYDVVFPSGFMISRMIKEGLLEPLNLENIPNLRHIDETFIQSSYDPGCQYSVPYTWGIVGIIYNKEMVPEPVDSWDILWDERYAGQILMFNNPSNAFGLAFIKLGYDINTEDPAQRQAAADLLKAQKPLVQAYVMDQIYDKMQGNEAALAPYYVGDFFTMKAQNDALEFAIPKEGTTTFVDAMCIPVGAKHQEAGEMYINFLNEPAVAAANVEYIGYSTPNLPAKALLPEEIQNDPLHYPTPEIMQNTQSFVNLSDETNRLTDELWVGIFNADTEGGASNLLSTWLVPGLIALAAIVVVVVGMQRRKRREQDYQ